MSFTLLWKLRQYVVCFFHIICCRVSQANTAKLLGKQRVKGKQPTNYLMLSDLHTSSQMDNSDILMLTL